MLRHHICVGCYKLGVVIKDNLIIGGPATKEPRHLAQLTIRKQDLWAKQ